MLRRDLVRTAAMLGLALVVTPRPTAAQYVIPTPPGASVTPMPGITFRHPGYGDPRAVVRGFDRRGGIGTTPFLGNTRGMGFGSVNYSAPARRRMVGPRVGRRYRVR
jgi:hypothetical protein